MVKWPDNFFFKFHRYCCSWRNLGSCLKQWHLHSKTGHEEREKREREKKLIKKGRETEETVTYTKTKKQL